MNLASELRLPNRLEETRQIGPWLREFAQRADLSAAVLSALDLALVEWVTNIISYAYLDAVSEHSILIRLKTTPGEACVEVEDDGREFNPLNHPPVDVNVPLEQRSIGGLGIHMITTVMDAVDYRRADGRNFLTLKKRIG